MASLEAAKTAVSTISLNFGHLDEKRLDKLEQFDPELRRDIERSFLAKDKIAGHAIITLAQNIYGSDARFVFELLQNADDNRFTRAIATKALPSVAFHIYTDRIVVECNEDGFTERDLQAICAVGQSSKSTSHGYIGAKGIGFKSVFIAAWKVHVQSGHFSFYFKHKRGDSGLGMVVPIWQDTEAVLQGPLTRMTLYLHEIRGESHLQDLRETIFKQLSDLQETSLLFLRQLKKIDVNFYDEHNALKNSRSFRSVNTDGRNVVLETTEKNTLIGSTTRKKQFHVTRHMASNLSRSVSRQIPDTEDARRAAAVAEVVLAFPLTNSLEPLLENQEFFAFLPIRESEFKFIIQSDFDTSANRQDIVTSSRRNIDLLGAIADAFIKAVLEFCQHSHLCYTWPSFLPSSQYASTEFWSGLKDRIQSRISETPTMMPRHGWHLQKIGALVALSSDFKDDAGNPLLDDSSRNVFLSGRYPLEVVTVLKQYGLQNTTADLFLSMLRADLKQTSSRMKSASTSQRWHSIMAQLLAKFKSDSRIQDIALLPLRSGRWVSPNSGTVYLPMTEELRVPFGVDMRILDPTAVANVDRNAFYIGVGAVEPSIADVRKAIGDAYSIGMLLPDLALSKAHLHYLYLSHLRVKKPLPEDYRTLCLRTSSGRTEIPTSHDIYLPTDHPYGARKLLVSEDDVPGFQVTLLHADYLLEAPETPDIRYPSWTTWLCEFLGVRARLRLVTPNSNAMSDTWTYVATHRPNKLLGMLEHLWKFEGFRIKDNVKLLSEIQSMDAGKLCISSLPKPCALSKTYLPLAPLRRHCERFMEQVESFPFLNLETTIPAEELRTKWLFLHEAFLVGIDDDLPFLLDILAWIKQSNPDASTVARDQRLIDLYVAIDAKCVACADQEGSRRIIEHFIAREECLYVPRSNGDPAGWTIPSVCLWDGPPGMLCKYSLKEVFKNLGPDRMHQVAHFFQYTLQVSDASWEDIIEELQTMEKHDLEDFDRIAMLYKRIATQVDDDKKAQRSVRKCFAESRLVCVFKNGDPSWHSTSECLWSSSTDIRGKVTLNDHYEDLRQFFVDVLGVRKLTLQMVYDELLQSESQSIAEVKGAIWSLNALLQSESATFDPEPLLKKKILPVSPVNGATFLTSVDVDFGIGDREYLTAQFKDQIKILDYDLAEVRRLTTFLEWAGLSSRYLSKSIKEVTSIGNGDVRTILLRTRDIKRKAHAILRIAATFNSCQYVADGLGLYETLRSIETMTTDEILSVLSLSQDGKMISVESEAGDLHIREVDGSVTIYVPRNRRKQEFCFASHLPSVLAAWLMRDPVTQIQGKVDGAMVNALTTLLAVTPSAVSLILDHQGIVQVPIPNQDLETYPDEDGDADPDSEDELDGNNAAMVRFTPPSGDDQSAVDHGVLDVVSEHARAGHGGRGGYMPSPASPYRAHSNDSDQQYRELLNKVVRAARRADFPLDGPFDMSALRDALSESSAIGYNGVESSIRYRTDNPLERNFKIGAAGELYVFEVISRLTPALHGWGRENWQSTIRDRVSVHADYAGMLPWNGRETADLVYDDSQGGLTAMLIDRGYLGGDQWRHARPRYYLEVKTTTGPSRTPFYVSKNQYQRMADAHDRVEQRAVVYMIMRVFEIEDESRIGMKVYVDPQQLKLDGQLSFTGESWSVVPL